MSSTTLKTSGLAVSATISASPGTCYDIIADYRDGHPKIIPPKYFGPIIVERGGVGAGTRIACSFKLFGRALPFSAEITEPVPGRVLREALVEGGSVTTFTVVDNGNGQAHVTIETRGPRRAGIGGRVERWIQRKYFPDVYTEELRLLASVAGGTLIGDPAVVIDL